MTLKPDENAYRALTTGAAVQVRDSAGVLALTGADRVDFLQRMTTNNMLLLRPGRSCVTVLTSPTAKIVQVFTVYPHDDALVLLPAPGETNALFRHLRGQIFFMDKVVIADHSASQFRLRVMGPAAGAVLAKLGVHVEGVEDGTVVENDNLVLVAQFAYDLPGFELVAPVEGASDFLERLAGAGATILEDDSAYHAHRVELGRPVTGHEVTSEYNPLEAGLGWACAENKGCYTGQEIIARQLTYDKVTRTLVGLVGEADLPAGGVVLSDGREVGAITSSAFSPALASPVALAMLKRPYNAPGGLVTVDGVSATVAALPLVGKEGSQ